MPTDLDPSSQAAERLFENYEFSLGIGYVQDCFHHLKVSRSLAFLFALPPLTAGMLNMTGHVLDARTCLNTDLVHPIPTALPMFFPGAPTSVKTWPIMLVCVAILPRRLGYSATQDRQPFFCAYINSVPVGITTLIFFDLCWQSSFA